MISTAASTTTVLGDDARDLVDSGERFVLFHKKVPYQAGWRKKASPTERATWAPYETVTRFLPFAHVYLGDSCGSLNKDYGIGFVLSDDDDIVGVDIDDAFDIVDGRRRIKATARTIVERLDTYTEISPSGTGLHLFCRGDLVRPDVNTGRKRRVDDIGLEIYRRGRYLTLTGREVRPRPINPRHAVFGELFDEYFPRREVSTSVGGSPRVVTCPEDLAILEAIRGSRQYAKFSRLWGGDTSGYRKPNGDDGDHSGADLALCTILAFWCGNDPATIDRLFRQSGLYRNKWERADYRDEWTIPKAIAATPDPYDWGRARTSSSYIYISTSSTQESSTGTVESTGDIRRTGTRDLVPGIECPA